MLPATATRAPQPRPRRREQHPRDPARRQPGKGGNARTVTCPGKGRESERRGHPRAPPGPPAGPARAARPRAARSGPESRRPGPLRSRPTRAPGGGSRERGPSSARAAGSARDPAESRAPRPLRAVNTGAQRDRRRRVRAGAGSTAALNRQFVKVTCANGGNPCVFKVQIQEKKVRGNLMIT